MSPSQSCLSKADYPVNVWVFDMEKHQLLRSYIHKNLLECLRSTATSVIAISIILSKYKVVKSIVPRFLTEVAGSYYFWVMNSCSYLLWFLSTNKSFINCSFIWVSYIQITPILVGSSNLTIFFPPDWKTLIASDFHLIWYLI